MLSFGEKISVDLSYNDVKCGKLVLRDLSLSQSNCVQHLESEFKFIRKVHYWWFLTTFQIVQFLV